MLPLSTETVLVIEDDDAVRRVIVRTLRTAGFRVQDASTGEEAIEFARRQDAPIDIVVTDTLLPGMSGPDAADAIRRFRPDVPVLHMSGFANGSMPASATSGAGLAAHFIAKPFCVTELVEAVRTILRRRALGGVVPQ